MQEKILVIEHISKRFGETVALSDVSISIKKGTITSLIGPNGSGKTTLFNIINGLIKPDKGVVSYRKEDITHLSPAQIMRRGIACLMQDKLVLPEMTALENVMIGFPEQDGEFILRVFFAWPRVAREECLRKQEALSLLEAYNLRGKEQYRSGDLSFGEQKRVALARLCATKADLLLLDEPAAGLEPAGIDKVIAALLDLKRQGKTLFLIEHNMSVVIQVSDYVYVMNQGRPISQGTPMEVQLDPKVVETYLGC